MFTSNSPGTNIAKILIALSLCAAAGMHLFQRYAQILDAETVYEEGNYHQGTARQALLSLAKSPAETNR